MEADHLLVAVVEAVAHLHPFLVGAVAAAVAAVVQDLRREVAAAEAVELQPMVSTLVVQPVLFEEGLEGLEVCLATRRRF